MKRTYPGPDFPAFPVVTVEVPEGWDPVAFPGPGLCYVDRETEATVPTSLTVTITRLPPNVSLEVAAERAELSTRERVSKLAVLAHQVGELDGRSALMRAIMIEAGDPPVAAAHAEAYLFASTDGRFNDLIEMRGISGPETTPETGPLFRSIFESIRIGGVRPESSEGDDDE